MKEKENNSIESAVEEYYKLYYEGVSNPKKGLALALKTHLCQEDAQMHIHLVEDYLELKGKKVLDVGSGFGCFVLAARKQNYDVYGAEIDDIMFQTSRKRLRLDNIDNEIIKKSEENKLPYDSEKFDIITLFNVLEHVEDIRLFLNECNRVLKKKGKLFIWGPNYLCCYEPHYELFFVPIMPRFIARIYLRLRGKKVKFLDTLNFAKPFYIEKTLSDLGMKIDNVGLKEWRQDLVSLSAKYRTPAGLNMLKLIRKLHLTPIASRMGNFGFYYPLKYIATKS